MCLCTCNDAELPFVFSAHGHDYETLVLLYYWCANLRSSYCHFFGIYIKLSILYIAQAFLFVCLFVCLLYRLVHLVMRVQYTKNLKRKNLFPRELRNKQPQKTQIWTCHTLLLLKLLNGNMTTANS